MAANSANSTSILRISLEGVLLAPADDRRREHDLHVIMPIHLHEILYRVKRRCLRFIRFPCNACFQEVCPVSMLIRDCRSE